MTEDTQPDWRTDTERANDIAQAKELRVQTSKGGLRFEAYLPPSLAEWVLDFVERGVFNSPSEAVFVILGEHRDLEPHADLRREILKRSLEAAMNDHGSAIPADVVHANLEKLMAEPQPEPAVWQRREVTSGSEQA